MSFALIGTENMQQARILHFLLPEERIKQNLVTTVIGVDPFKYAG
jgi:hypothetical protein